MHTSSRRLKLFKFLRKVWFSTCMYHRDACAYSLVIGLYGLIYKNKSKVLLSSYMVAW